MTITTVLGARPQFIKASVLSRLLRDTYVGRIRERIVHTGQHYDDAMSGIFFRELGIPDPDINLGVGSGPHGRMTGEMLARIEEDLEAYRPDVLLVYGDTNSTLAGALAASKMGIPVAHVEAGLRSHWKPMPEEQNRVLTDHLATLLYCPTGTARENLLREGISEGVHVTGDIMYDAALACAASAKARPAGQRALARLDVRRPFLLLTLHRAENTDDRARLSALVAAVNARTDWEFLFPVHPRTRKALEESRLVFGGHVRLVEPVGYLDMLELEEASDVIVTDSGGMQKEAYFFRRPCITLRDQTEWVETVEVGANVLVGADADRLAQALANPPSPRAWPEVFGNGRSAAAIASILATGAGSLPNRRPK